MAATSTLASEIIMKIRNLVRLATLGSMTVCLAAAVIVPASAQSAGGGGGGGGVNSFGDCSGDINTTWILDAEPHGDQIRVEAQVFAHVLDEVWGWHLTDNGRQVAHGTAITNKEHQDRTYFRIRRTIADLPGSDVIEFKSTRVGSGQVCDGQVTL